jgi:hypothetical protein
MERKNAVEKHLKNDHSADQDGDGIILFLLTSVDCTEKKWIQLA